MPSSLRPKVKTALHTIMNAENKEAADLAIDQFETIYCAKYPKAVDKLLKDREVLLTHFRFPAEHWIHLRTTNVIESTFATVKLRTRKTKGAGSRSAGLAMAYKLLDAAQARWRSVNAPTWSRSFALGRLSWMAFSSSARTSGTPHERHLIAAPIHNI
ncbi:MAG: transposase [Chloroflexi bacterium]|nr:transposase [Chloroflexota bacterium]MBV9599626.1 transposase [Chloroflexota bacterium]